MHGNILGNAGAITSVLRVPWRRQQRATPPNGWRCLRLGAIITHPCWVARLLGVHITQAATLIISGNTATGIGNLEVNGSFYNVEFVFDSAINVYGSPRVFDFKNDNDALAAVEALIAALNGEPAVTGVGPQGSQNFLIGYSESEIFGFPFTNSWQGRYLGSIWGDLDFDTDEADDVKSYADFTVASVEPPPGADVISLTAGDVTGDGRAEIIATYGDGIGTWYWDPMTLAWTRVKPPR